MELDRGLAEAHFVFAFAAAAVPLKSEGFQQALKDHSSQCFSVRAANVMKVSFECLAIVHSVAGDMSIQP